MWKSPWAMTWVSISGFKSSKTLSINWDPISRSFSISFCQRWERDFQDFNKKTKNTMKEAVTLIGLNRVESRQKNDLWKIPVHLCLKFWNFLQLGFCNIIVAGKFTYDAPDDLQISDEVSLEIWSNAVNFWWMIHRFIQGRMFFKKIFSWFFTLS